MSKPSTRMDRREPTIAPLKSGAGRCLVVHDDLELRLRLAALVRRAIPKMDADCLSTSSFDALAPDRLAGYLALLLIVEFSLRDSTVDPLARLMRARELSPHLPIYVFARGGDERNAARTIKLGANDYWPIHSVIIGEVGAALQPLIDSAVGLSDSAIMAPIDPWRQPKIAGYSIVKTIADSSAASVYLARNDQLPQPVAVEFMPVLFAGLLNHFGQKGPAEIDSKRRFTYRFALWRARKMGISMRMPPNHPFNPIMALRLIIAAGSTRPVIERVLDAVFLHGRDVADVGVIAELAGELGVADPANALQAADVKQKLRENTDWAIRQRVFGVPTLIVDDEINITDMLTIGLERFGYEVTCCNDPTEALHAFE